jgi:hypothetical protein
MYNMFSTYFLERYARDHHVDLLAEAEKARLIKEASLHLTPRRASRTRDAQFNLRSILTVLASNISQT